MAYASDETFEIGIIEWKQTFTLPDKGKMFISQLKVNFFL